MTEEEYRSFLLDRSRTAVLATVRADGRPHVAPIWFDMVGDVLVFTTAKALSRDATCAEIPASASASTRKNRRSISSSSKAPQNSPPKIPTLYWAMRIRGRYIVTGIAALVVDS
jgi:predicted pyridoxine 5'-phosphate oxidase superfamily flavin-nucleotide-binding protein